MSPLVLLALSGALPVAVAGPVVYAAVWSRPDRARRAVKVLKLLLRHRREQPRQRLRKKIK
ncbi:hypothetical protein [Amycolatopsis sp. NPDC004169]|uniref:hypothetical protein n=1 Tax=Amycolatopsis sp. NPDC004169 TaxID=3154453 RepID=UPI0033B67B8E